MRGVQIHHSGDLIRKIEIQKGYSYRPLWKTLESLSPQEMVIWVDRMDSLCPVSCEWALAQALETSANVAVSTRAQLVRSIYCEINRFVYLTTYLANVVKQLGLETLYQYAMILREQVFQKQEEFTGGRILPQALSVGGVRRDLALGDVQKVQAFIKDWRASWVKWKEIVIDDPLLEDRLSDLLKISQRNLKEKAIWGIMGKASGLTYDARLHQPHGAYSMIDFKLKYEFPLKGDALSRFNVAVAEVDISLNACEGFLNLVNQSESISSAKADHKFQAGIFSGAAESARGPVTSFVEVDEQGRVRGVKLFNCSQRIWPTIENYFEGIRSEEFELSWASLGFSSEEAET